MAAGAVALGEAWHDRGAVGGRWLFICTRSWGRPCLRTRLGKRSDFAKQKPRELGDPKDWEEAPGLTTASQLTEGKKLSGSRRRPNGKKRFSIFV